MKSFYEPTTRDVLNVREGPGWDWSSVLGHLSEAKPVYCGACVERHAGRPPATIGFLAVDGDGGAELVTRRRQGLKSYRMGVQGMPLEDDDRPRSRATQRDVYFSAHGTGAEMTCPSCGHRASVRLPRLVQAAEGWPAVLVPFRGRPRGTHRI